MKNRKIFVRIVALFMALLMALSVLGVVVFSIMASAADTSLLTAVVATGSEARETRWPIYAAVGAVLVVIVCVVVPMMTKKK